MRESRGKGKKKGIGKGRWVGGQVDNQDQVQRNQEHNKIEGTLYTKRM